MPFSTDPFSHTGLTVAAVLIVEYLLRQVFTFPNQPRNPAIPVGYPSGPVSGESRFARRRKWRIDYRWVIIGALLPDLIDRPLGLGLVPEMFAPSGRLFAHTLLFNASLIALSLMAVGFRASLTPLAFAVASAGHLLFDRMWESPQTLLWPLRGFAFGRAETSLSPDWLQWMHTGASQMVIDGSGALVLLLCAVWLYNRRTFFQWLKTGVG